MNEVASNVLYFFLGAVMGLGLGWILATMRYARQARDTVQELKHKLDESGWYRHTFSLVIVLGLTATAAIWTGVVNTQQHKSQQCTERALGTLVSALEERTSLSTELALADSDQNKAFSKLLTALLTKPQPSKHTRRRLFTDYAMKLSNYLKLQDAQRNIQKTNPLPRHIEYHNCLEGKE